MSNNYLKSKPVPFPNKCKNSFNLVKWGINIANKMGWHS